MTSTFIISGLIVGSVTLLLALTFVINKNRKYIAMLKAYGYTEKECGRAMFGGYRIITYIGFVIGTIYQFLFIAFIIARAFDNATVNFDVIGFCVALSVFIIVYEFIIHFYKHRIAGINLNEIMQK
jgi:predicted lysophospholipase L1 biosynthesis ABC-type transport system permease subunit